MISKVVLAGLLLHAAGLLADTGPADNSWMVVVAVALLVVGVAAFFLGRRRKDDAQT